MKNKRKDQKKDVSRQVNSNIKKTLSFREISREFAGLAEEFADGKVGLKRDKGASGHVDDPLPTTWNKGKKPIMEHHSHGNKRIKREISHLWKECVKQIRNGEDPEQAVATDLLRQCEEYNLYTGRQWTDEWRICFKVMSQSLAVASAGNFDQAVALIDQANQLKKECHKRFKK